MGKTIRHAGWPLAIAMTLGLLAGCGEAPGTVVDDGKHIKDLQISSPNRGAGVPNQQAFIQQLMQDVQAVRANTRNLKFDLSGYFVSEQSGAPGSSLVHYSFEKPNKTAVTIAESSDPRTVGTKIVWTGGQQMAVKTKFIGFWIKTSIDERDPRAADQRGYFLDQTCVSATLDTLLDPGNQVTFMGFGNLGGTPIAQLDVVSPRRLKGISHDVFTIDGYRKAPIVREMYDQHNKLVFRIRMDNIQLNTTLPADTFNLD